MQNHSDSDEDDGDLFKPANGASSGKPTSDLDAIDAVDTSCVPVNLNHLQQWDSADAKEGLRNRFVTGEQ